MHEIESTGDESEDIRGRRDRKRKSVDKLSGAARRKLAKGATLKMNASKCLKLTSFLTKLPLVEPVKVSTEEFEDKPVSDDQHPTTSSSRPTEPNETETTPASGLEHNMQTDLTLPVTSATAERSFSKLKLIKSYLRSTMTNERLSGLALISIERGLAENIDLL
jgi:hypothetical protein